MPKKEDLGKGLPRGVQFTAYDEPDKRDYLFEDWEEIASSDNSKKRPKSKFKVRSQGYTPGCTMFSGMHIVNGLNLVEDDRLGVSRKQQNPLTQWETFCTQRGFSNAGSSIQTIGGWLKNNGYIEGYVSIPSSTEKEKQIRQMKSAIDMGNFISTGSAYGDWATIKKTGVYSERADRKFVGHAFAIVDYKTDKNGNLEYFWAVNSYGDKWGQYNGYFLIPADMVDKLYSKLCFIDKDDSSNFKNLSEIQKIKQGLINFRYVYNTTDKVLYRALMDKLQIGNNLSDIYGVIL